MALGGSSSQREVNQRLFIPWPFALFPWLIKAVDNT
jgi:hypothetical protein